VKNVTIAEKVGIRKETVNSIGIGIVKIKEKIDHPGQGLGHDLLFQDQGPEAFHRKVGKVGILISPKICREVEVKAFLEVDLFLSLTRV